MPMQLADKNATGAGARIWMAFHCWLATTEAQRCETYGPRERSRAARGRARRWSQRPRRAERGVTLEEDLQLSSIHEASHCVIYWAYGYKIRYARLTAEGGGWMSVRCFSEKELNAFARLAAIVAGEIGEEELLGHAERRETVDRKHAMEIAAKIDPEMPYAVLDCARRQAHRLVRANADAIRMLAAVLIERGELDGTSIATLLLNHQGRWRRAA
jgi:hypothetical protein